MHAVLVAVEEYLSRRRVFVKWLRQCVVGSWRCSLVVNNVAKIENVVVVVVALVRVCNTADTYIVECVVD